MQSLRLSQWLTNFRPAALQSVLVTGNGKEHEPCRSPNFMALGGLRFRHSKRVNTKVQRKGEEGIQYHGFKFYPRSPDHKDPPYQPAKLFMVKRIRSTFGCPHWEKDLIERFNLKDKGEVAIVKNTPGNNARLYRIKHLVEITAISTPFGMPDNPEHGFLKENGEFIACHSLAGHQLQLEESKTANDALLKKSVDGPTLRVRLHKNWYSRYSN